MIRLKGSFTIEASVIVPLTLIITVSFITLAAKVCGNVKELNEEICCILEDPENYEDNEELIMSIPDGREELLRYKAMADGAELITGDEDED